MGRKTTADYEEKKYGDAHILYYFYRAAVDSLPEKHRPLILTKDELIKRREKIEKRAERWEKERDIPLEWLE